MKNRREFLIKSLSASLAVGFPVLAAAQKSNWPDRAITTVLPYPAGGGTDRLARIVTSNLAARLESPIVVDNRAGATGMIGTAHAARSAPDGYTFLFGFLPTIAVMPAMHSKLQYDSQEDFEPVCRIATYSFMLVAQPDFPEDSLAGIIERSKKSGPPLAYATHGIGSPTHLAMQQIGRLSQAGFQHAPYKGESPMVTDLLGKHIPMGWLTVNVAEPLIKSGKLKPIVMGSPRRSSRLPDTPTLAEQGYEAASFENWAGLLAPRGTSGEIVEKMSHSIHEVIESPDVKAELIEAGFTPDHLGPQAFKELIQIEVARYAKLVEAEGLRS